MQTNEARAGDSSDPDGPAAAEAADAPPQGRGGGKGEPGEADRASEHGSSSSSSGDSSLAGAHLEEVVWRPYAERPEWAGSGVRPRAVSEGPTAVVRPAYTPEQEAILAQFRGAVAAGELSERVLALTGEVRGPAEQDRIPRPSEQVIEENAAHYGAWDWRWRCLEALPPPQGLDREGAFIDRLSEDDPKNYQLWNHRRKYALWKGEDCAAEELADAGRWLRGGDAKNYHAWAHRAALAARFACWEAELAFTGELLERDVRNNSAWSQRLWVLGALLGGQGRGSSLEEAGSGDDAARRTALYESELEFVSAACRRTPHNASPWAALRGLAALRGTPGGLEAQLAGDARLLTLCTQVLADHPFCPPALLVLADVYAAKAAQAGRRGDGGGERRARGAAAACFQALGKADVLRTHLWQFCAAEVRTSSRTGTGNE